MMVMCVSCGRFVAAYERDASVEVFVDRCPDCGETRFKDVDRDEYVDLE